MTKVSIIIPVYNGMVFLAEAITSALAARTEDTEIIVVDDGSTDASAQIAASFNSIILIRQENGGEAAARNTGLKRSSGDFVIFLDADDVLEKSAITNHLKEILAHPELDMVFGSNLIIDEKGQKIGRNDQPCRRFSGRDIVLHTTPTFSQCMYRRTALDRIGGFRISVRRGADIDLNLRLLGWNAAGSCHGRMVVSYRLHPNQMTKSPTSLFKGHIDVLRNALGAGSVLENPRLLNEGIQYWAQYYGQFIPMEIARSLRHGNISHAADAVATFVRALPHSIIGALSHARRKLFQAKSKK